MRYKFFAFWCTFIFAVNTQQAVSQNFDSVKIKTIKITETIYMLEGDGGNIGVLTGKDGIVMIDDQFAPLSEKIKTALKALSDKPVRFIINTHFHGDHTGGNENFGGEGAIIVAQENTRVRMNSDQFIAAFNTQAKAAPYNALPKVTFTESVTLHLNGQTVQVFHVKNAHTDGDAIIYFKESNVFHAGDVFVRYGLPFIDQPNGGSIDGMISGVDQLLTLVDDNSKIIPGHGALCGKKELFEYKEMLVTVRDRILNAINQGKTLEQIINMDPVKEFPAVFERKDFIKTVYDSLKK
jgi:glyoxylase-like metal-dependent hydrolase (beta-lactamase superfamily II)